MGETELRLVRLALTDFRNYPHLVWQPGARLVCITGPNGAGKTNLLEAISLLVPGRGLRGARAPDLGRHDPSGTPWPWAINGRFTTPSGELEVATGTLTGAGQPPAERRVFRLDGQPARSQAAIGARLAAVWLTPQMDRLFTDSASGRRRFLDRLVIALVPTHAREIAGFEAAAAQRNRLLQENPDPTWLAGLEDAMARHAVAATATRAELISRLNATLAAGAADPFPRVQLALRCVIGERLRASPALAAEDALRGIYARARREDATQRGAGTGPQRADLVILDAHSGRGAEHSSTGQQKSMLIGIVLGHAALIATTRGTAPLLLLDEPLVHLDAPHRAALFAALESLNLTAWLTGTDAEPFAPLRGEIYTIREGSIDPL